MRRRDFIKCGALFLPSIFVQSLKAQSTLTADGLAAFTPKPATGGGGDTLTIITGQSISSGTRNDVTGNVGVLFDIGATPITITQLGRWVVSGNSQTHTLILTDSSCSVLASCTVNCSGATAGQYLYGAITATTLSAGGTYRIMSSEISGGDLWYEQDAVTISSALTAAQAAHNISGGCGLGAGGESYVPVNAKYH